VAVNSVTYVQVIFYYSGFKC